MRATVPTHRSTRVANFRVVLILVLAIAALVLLAWPHQLVSALRKQSSETQKTSAAPQKTESVTAQPATNVLGTNLIINGDAELGSGDPNGATIETVPGWTTSGNFTVGQYGSCCGLPDTTSPGPTNRGNNLFIGGPNNGSSSASQLIDVSAAASSIDGGAVTYNLDGYLGGYQEQNDNAVLTVTSEDTNGTNIGTASIGPVSSADRNNITGLLPRSSSGTVPVSTRQIAVLLQMTRTDGAYNDSYADNLSLVLNTCATPPSGMVSWWPGDSNANDIQGTNNGTVQGSVTFPTGEVGQAFGLNGTNQYVSIPDSPSLQVSNLTIDAWVNFNNLHPDHAQIIFSKSVGASGNKSYVLYYQSGAFHGATCNNASCSVLDFSVSPTLGTWNHVAYTFDGSNHTLYLNGAQVATTANTVVPQYDAHTVLIGGAHQGDVNSSVIDFFDGEVDEVELFNRALSQSEIQSIYNAGSAGKCKPASLAPTSISSVSGSGVYGGTATLTATLTSNNSALSGKIVSFTLNGNAVCGGSTGVTCPTTDSHGVATLAGVSLAGINAGSYNSAVAASFAADATYDSSSGTGTLTVSKATPTITWNNPSNIIYGTALDGTQLNAGASVPGGFVYTPAASTVLHTGNNQTLHVDFTPTDTTNYNTASKDVSINVTKAVLTITADDKQKSYRAANPTFTYTSSGFVNNDTASILSGAPSITTTATTTSAVNTYTITITQSQQNPLSAVHNSFDDYSLSFVNGTLTINKATPTITWSNPSDITYGTALSGTQLNATATNPNDSSSVAGTFTYNPVLPTVLHAGNGQTLKADFAPTDTSNYNTPAQKTVSINVLKATLTITADDKTKSYRAANPPFTYTPTGFVNNDTASILSGNPNYSTTATPTSTVGNYTITITQSQQNPLSTAHNNFDDYTFNFVNGTLTVTKATPVISWNNPADIVFGTALGASQLNATASNPNDGSGVTGNFVYTPAANTVLNAGNNQTLAVNFTPAGTDASSYNTPAQKTVAINVLKAGQTVTFNPLSDKTFGDAPFTVSATASSGLSVSFQIVSGPATINNNTNTVTINGTGTVTVRALQAGNNNYNAAPNVDRSFTVINSNQTITFGALANKTFGDSDFTVSATASSGLSVSFAASGQCTVSGNTVHITGAGSCTITASQGGNSNYSAAANVLQTFSIAKADQTIAFGSLANKVVSDAPFNVSATATSGLPVSFSILSGPASVSGNTVTITGAGTVTVRATQTGNSNYNAAPNVDQSFIVTSTPATPVNGQFVFTVAGNGLITTSSADGKVVKQLGAAGLNPAWSPDGTKIVFSRIWSTTAGAGPHLSVMNADGSNQVNISSPRETDHQFDSNPAWSPDGQSIAWNCDFSGTGTAFIICIRKVSDNYGWVQVPTSNLAGNMGAPAWSPDSKKIVFSSRDVSSGPFSFLFIYDLASGTLTKLNNAFGSSPDLNPNWSPDGSKIIYRGFSGLSVINADGSNERDLTNGLERMPKWSLDMKQIAFIDQDFNNSDKQSISVMNIDGTNRTQIFKATNPIESFDWQMPPTNVPTPTGASVNVTDGAVNLNFSSINNGGTTSVIPIDPASAGTLPGGFAVDGTSLAFDVTTTASYTAPIKVCFNVPPVSGQTSAQFFALKVLHGENGVLVDRTISHDFSTRTICASVSSLSPFVVATDLNASNTNQLDDTQLFIRQQYLDFLGREPEPPGLQGWLNILNNCPSSGIDANGNHCDRIEVSSDFFRSEEFQERGYFIYRFYSTLGRVPHFAEFMADFSEVSGFLTPAQVEANKTAFVDEFMNRQEFQDKYGSITDPTAFVDALLQTVGLPNHSSRSTWIAGLSNGTLARAQVLRALIDSPEMVSKYYNEAFVVMEYFGYLRRDPDILYLNWIQTMNQNGGDYRVMINGFMNSLEYRQRFGP